MRPRRPLRHAVTALWAAGVVVLGWLLWPSSLGGCTTVTIVSGSSMEPTYVTGDLVVSRCGEVAVGDVVVYEPEGMGGVRVIHRVVGGDADGWVVQGDNNDFTDPWLPSTDEHVLGSAVLHVPGLGSAAGLLLSPFVWLSLLVLALAVLVWPGADDVAAAADDVAEPAAAEAAAPSGTARTAVPEPSAPRTADAPTPAPDRVLEPR